MSELQEVDFMLIRRLKRDGRWDDAQDLLDAYGDCRDRQRKQDKKEKHRIDCAVRRIKLKRRKICVVCAKPNPSSCGWCPDCLKKKREAHLRKINIRKIKGLCTMCGVEKSYSFVMCLKCRERQRRYQNEKNRKSKRSKRE